ncbi:MULTISPECIES: hypothetical protein [unclassified Thioalkalivibrio]|uniref:hypothetical protein n=1 Tax=unclassified Thioalkalivibrio TaxID=2621013 RepID=UPI0012DBFF21|nr:MULTISPECIES: hypothetical protein [unclassified Thioalkalivibrio]
MKPFQRTSGREGRKFVPIASVEVQTAPSTRDIKNAMTLSKHTPPRDQASDPEKSHEEWSREVGAAFVRALNKRTSHTHCQKPDRQKASKESKTEESADLLATLMEDRLNKPPELREKQRRLLEILAAESDKPQATSFSGKEKPKRPHKESLLKIRLITAIGFIGALVLATLIAMIFSQPLYAIMGLFVAFSTPIIIWHEKKTR